MYHSSTLWKKDSLHTQILRSERAGIGAVVVVVVVVVVVDSRVSLDSIEKSRLEEVLAGSFNCAAGLT